MVERSQKDSEFYRDFRDRKENRVYKALLELMAAIPIFHIKYSHLQNPVKPTDISDTPNDYIGTYVDFSEDDSTDPAAYKWARFKGLQGAKGDQGIPVQQLVLTARRLICILNTPMTGERPLTANNA